MDSNIDWGQDLLCLKDRLDEHPEVKLDGLAFHGPYPAALAGIPETPYPPTGPQTDHHNTSQPADMPGPSPGRYAVSVNKIRSRTKEYAYFLRFEPVASAGYSIYIYHITIDEANRVRKELGLRALAEDWQSPSRADDEDARKVAGNAAHEVRTGRGGR